MTAPVRPCGSYPLIPWRGRRSHDGEDDDEVAGRGSYREQVELTKKQSTQILEELATLAAKQARNGFVFPGVGKLVVVKRKARMGRNPQTGEAIKIPAKTVLKFRIAKAMKELALK